MLGLFVYQAGFYYSASESIKMTDKLIAASQETIKTNVVAKIERL